MRAPVVISGIGPVSAMGFGIEATWEAMTAGRSGLGPVQAFNASDFSCSFAGEVDAESFSIRKIVPKSYRKAVKVMCRDIELAIGAASAAVEDAGLLTAANADGAAPTIDPERMGCHVGAGLICSEVNELTAALWPSRGPDGLFDLHHWGEQGMENLTPLWLLKYLPNMLACHVTIVHECRGPSNTITCCESSSALSLGESLRVIERGDADACLTGGAESRLNPMAFYRQCCSGRLAETAADADYSAVLRPYDPSAQGTLLGEGGGILVLESQDCLERRGGRARATIEGFACTQSFDDDGFGASADCLGDAIHAALASADCTPGDIDVIVPFGSSIPAIDAAERDAFHATLGDRASEIPLICTIPFTGNCTAGNGAIGLCVAAAAISEQALPARLNAGAPDGLNASAADAVSHPMKRVLVTSASQGGQNTAVILGRAES
ncbi:MAG: beta-ketoacyl synthase N-terminal-like domain-containing protein [Planctomycetota bacterium]|nr:beta-ketoacyl synthase N-terminal-like domain-containing protein [Planctomycetota bacterium]